MSLSVYPTEADFNCHRKFCGFYVRITESEMIVEERGDALITKDDRNGSLSLLWLGTIKNAIKELRLQSASIGSYSGYYVDYSDNREKAKKEAIDAARNIHQRMMHHVDLMLAKMQATELTFIKQCKC